MKLLMIMIMMQEYVYDHYNQTAHRVIPWYEEVWYLIPFCIGLYIAYEHTTRKK